MNKEQAIHTFWSSLGLPAYDETTVPTGNKAPMFPYITYSVTTDDYDNDVSLSGSLWYRSTSWVEISKKANEIAKKIHDIKPIPIDGGYLWLKRGSPFAQRMSDPSDDMIRRILINLTVNFLTAY